MSIIREQADRAAEVAADTAVAAVLTPAVARAAAPVTHRVARRWPWLIVVPLVFVVFIILPIGMTILVTITPAESAPVGGIIQCTPGAVGTLDDTQSARAAEIIAVATEQVTPWATTQGLDVAATVRRASIVAIATALQESGLRNLASRKVPESISYPNDGVAAGDHLSVGTFQQQPWWWADGVADGMNPVYQARQFFGGPDDTPGIPGLLDTPGWVGMPVTVAAQHVQRSAYPTAYADDEPKAVAAVAALLGDAGGDPCATRNGTALTGAVGLPVPPGAYNLSARFGQCGARWAACHTGLDFATGTGTPPVYAAAAGTVIESADLGDRSYGQFILIDHGGGIVTRYAHLSQRDVQAGDTVAAGDQIGLVGSTGNSTGNHLHFEVLVDSNPTDPIPWLNEKGVTP